MATECAPKVSEDRRPEASPVYIERCDDDLGGKIVMQFHLLYSGRLLGASRGDTRATHKDEIRQFLNPQLGRLWRTNKGLFEHAKSAAYHWAELHPECIPLLPKTDSPFSEPDEANAEELVEMGIKYLAHKWRIGDRGYVPLVTEEMGLRCTLEILFLRPESPGRILQSGDIDNRLKTVFDALKIPRHAEGLSPSLDAPATPTFCLLEDDRLVSEVRIATDNLLLLPNAAAINPNDVFLVIDVKLQAPLHGEWAFTFG